MDDNHHGDDHIDDGNDHSGDDSDDHSGNDHGLQDQDLGLDLVVVHLLLLLSVLVKNKLPVKQQDISLFFLSFSTPQLLFTSIQLCC